MAGMRTFARWFAPCLLVCACDSGAPDAPFPKGFLFGVATAGFQSDPGCPTVPAALCEDRHSDWYHFVTDPALVGDRANFVTGEPLSNAPGSYELFETDFDLVAQRLHGNAVRLSLEWSRIFPTSTVGISGHDALRQLSLSKAPAALPHYHAVFAALKARGLVPLVTLHHYTLPDWIHDTVACHKDLGSPACQAAAGWLDRGKVVAEIEKYAGFVAQEFGAEVDLWATLNEPFAVLVPGFMQPTPDRTNPPSLSFAYVDPQTPALPVAAEAMITAHARMYDAVRRADTVDADGDGRAARVGLVYNLTPTVARDPQKPLDVQAAKNLFYLFNQYFLNAVIRGDFDQKRDGQTIVHRDDLAGRMDYLGVNYYTRVVVDGLSAPFNAGLRDISPLATFNPVTLNTGDEYAPGLADMVQVVRGYGLPVLVTENGTASTDDADAAPRYLVQHLQALQGAIAAGAGAPAVEGYFYWTLVDNYEWNHGMSMRFGLYGLGSGKSRTPRPAADVFAQVAGAGALSGGLIRKYATPAVPAVGPRGITGP